MPVPHNPRSDDSSDAARTNAPLRVTATDLAILTAFCRPYLEHGRFRCPAPNNKILEELGQDGVYLDLDSLRTHLRNLYARFGVEDGLTPTEKRARLAELVYENNVIPGWGPEREPATESPGAPPPPTAADTSSIGSSFAALVRDRAAPRVLAFAAVVVVALVAVVAWMVGDEPADSPRGGPRIAAVAPSSMTGARGNVTYCTGEDVVTSRNGRLHQHDAAVAAFNDRFSPDLHASLHQFADDATRQYEQFASLQRRRSGDCDVFYSDVIWTADFAHNRWLLDLSPYAKPRLNRFVEGMRDAAVFDGRVWGIPKQADAALLYYDKGRVKDPPDTWQELYEDVASRAKRLRYQADAYEGLTVNFLELAYAVGARDIVLDGKANINQPKALIALQFMVDGIRRGVAPREVALQREGHSLRAFGEGRADYMRNWPYAYAALQDDEAHPGVAGAVGVVPLPSWGTRAPVTVLGGHVLVVSAFSDNPAAALRLVDFLSSAEVVKRDAIEFSLAPALVGLWDDPEVQRALPVFDDLKRAIFTARSRPVTPNYEAISAAIYKNVNRALRGVPPEEALEAAQDEMQQALDEVYRRP